jgi:hypothetical protein
MSRNTNQSVGGTFNISISGTTRPARVTGTGAILARRRHAARRAKKLAALKRRQAKARASAREGSRPPK